MVVQINMHPQVVEEVKAGKPYIFSPLPKNITQETAYGWKVGKNLLKISLKKRIMGQSRKQNRPLTLNITAGESLGRG